MIIGVPKEIKNNENRVGMTPGGAKGYLKRGHKVIVEAHAGEGSGFMDDEYKAVGCEVYPDVKKLFQDADMIIKVKEPLPSEYGLVQRRPDPVYLPASGSRAGSDRSAAQGQGQGRSF